MQKEGKRELNSDYEVTFTGQSLGPYESFLKKYAEKNQQTNAEPMIMTSSIIRSDIQQAIGRVMRIPQQEGQTKGKPDERSTKGNPLSNPIKDQQSVPLSAYYFYLF